MKGCGISEVCAVLVTRGDVDMAPIIAELPYEEILVYDNSQRPIDFKVFGRYMGILETSKPIIYFQDDDCLVRNHAALLDAYKPGHVVGNFRDDVARYKFYEDTTLLGWGSLFDRGLPFDAFFRYARYHPLDWQFMTGLGAEFTFPMLTPNRKILVDIEAGGAVEWLKEDGAEIFARSDRMSNQPGFKEELDDVMRRARHVRNRDRDLLEQGIQ